MSLQPQYARPRTASQAAELLDGLGSGAMIIAGGQELMPHVNYGRLMPTVYVDVGALTELQGINEADGIVSIGAATVHRALQRDPIVRRSLPLLAYAAGKVGGGWQVQNRGTVGGNLVSMHPLYDIAPSLLALGADVDLQGANTSRSVALAALLQETSHGLGTTTLLTRIRVWAMAPRTGWAYEKLRITAGSYGSANCAAVVSVENGRLLSLRIVIGAVSEKPIDASNALKSLLGRSADAAAGEELERACSQLVAQPLDDQQGDAGWRRAMAGVVARRAYEAAVARAIS